MPLPAGFAPIDFLRFHTEELPALLAAGRDAFVRRATRHLRSLALRLADGPAYTYRPRALGFEITPGDAAADTVIELDAESWQRRGDRYRISAIVSFARPDVRHHRGEASYNDVLHQRAADQIEHLDVVARRR